MAWQALSNTNLYGRRLGLQAFSTSVSGSAVSGRSFDALVGPEFLRQYVSSAETTGVNLPAHGLSILTTSTGGTTSSLYTLDPPIPGVTKTIIIASSGTASNMIGVLASTGATITIVSSQGSTMCIVQSTGGVRGSFQLVGRTTAEWAMLGTCSSATFNCTTATC